MLELEPRTIACVVGARPNFVKIAPIMRAISARKGLVARLIHTGQHYDVAMNAVFFDELSIPSPDVNLEVGSGTGTEQTARIMLGMESELSKKTPDLLLVVGDVNSTVASALVAAKLRIPIAHVEAGLRSKDRSMPEEINRLVTDRLSDLLFTTEHSAVDNLIGEGVSPGRIVFVGNVMIDTLHACLHRAAPARETLTEIGVTPAIGEDVVSRGFALVTLHRPSNVDDRDKLALLLEALAGIAQKIPLVFPLHPRTGSMIESADLGGFLRSSPIIVAPPLSYLRAIGLMREARFVVTDSGGVQEETTALGTPCLTVRNSTERPITIEQGTNQLVATLDELNAAVDDILDNGGKKGRIPPLWDGRAAERIAEEIDAFLAHERLPLPA
ncbi:UDP-N-acetyl glucosamine 2-epimerase [Methylosinus sp. R-45379]|uniref:non-hydrolyzing UDP-N-acetylglucosamine 2-epimerase n=1 Tax=Methylosinus sp. R-45379 TaxID=980563 RepID=UPI0007C8E7D3|nr:UDP-N-acetylglucosamine 2-epimerase (non-hydrolyzing) [Methylosinus sp. R-45379]OAI24517.1 UDP-N-acetyl glucosamine 2-epimerase [Methylosinus sp. R-45379]